MAQTDDILKERTRAEDILLGALGYGEDAHIVSIKRTESGFCGEGCFSDGERFGFSSEEELTDLEKWALGVLLELVS